MKPVVHSEKPNIFTEATCLGGGEVGRGANCCMGTLGHGFTRILLGLYEAGRPFACPHYGPQSPLARWKAFSVLHGGSGSGPRPSTESHGSLSEEGGA